MSAWSKTLLTAALISASAPLVAAADVPGAGREPSREHEITLSLGTLPPPNFRTGLTLYGSYSFHFTRWLGWEAIGGFWFFKLNDIGDELTERFDVQKSTMGPPMDGVLNSNFILTPLHGRFSFGGGGPGCLATVSLLLGPAVTKYDRIRADDPGEAFGFDAGVSIRLGLDRHIALRFDLREYVFFPDANHYLHISLGVSFLLPQY